jgi:hypothetical protein
MGEARILARRRMKVRLTVPLVVAILGAIGLYWFGKWSERQGAEDRNIIQAAQRSLATGKAYRAHMAKLKTVSRVHADSARTIQVTIPPITLTMTPVQLRGAALDWQRVALQWELAFRAESLRAVTADTRVVDLETRLREVLTVADCHILGVSFLPRCPSRTVSFVLGAAAGATVVLLAPKLGPR